MPWGVLEYTIGANKYIPIVPNPKQFQFLALECEDAMYGGSAGGGKALATCTPILTTAGWKTMGTLAVGDFVLGMDHQPTEVLAKSEVMLNHDCYRVVFHNDYEGIIADGEHLWLTTPHFDNQNPEAREGIWTTLQLRDTVYTKSPRDGMGYPTHAIPLRKPFGSIHDVVVIVGVDPVASVPVQCIKVAAADGMFLAGRNLVPTHNSAALLMAALQFVSVPHYSAMILRRSYADLKQPGALIDMSREWLSKSDANYNSQDHRWRFPSGASLQFGYAESDSDIYRYKGSEFQFVGIDEASEMTEIQLRYLFSRMRRRNDIPVPMRYRLATNPGGKSHEFIKDRYIKNPGERVFIKATLDDNDAIDKDQYRAMLDNLDPVNRAQLLMGDWDVAASGRFKREDLEKSKYEIVDEGFGQGGAYLLGNRRVMVADCWKMITVDPASTSKDTSDYTVVSTFAVTPCRQLVWLDMLRFRKEIPEIVQEIQSAYWQWQPAFVAIEAVASNRAVLQIAQRTNMTVREVSPRGLDKLVRATPAMQLASEGRLWMPKKAHWLEAAVQELLVFSGNPTKDAHDDVVDALSYASALMGEFDDSNEGFKPMLLFGRKW